MSTLKRATDQVLRQIQANARSINGKEFRKVGLLLSPEIVLEIDDSDLASMPDTAATEIRRIQENFINILQTELKVIIDNSIVENGLVDTGNLKSSLIVTTGNDGINIAYTAPYAALLHFGGYIIPYGNQNAKPVYIPGRPWVDMAIAKYDFNNALSRAIDAV